MKKSVDAVVARSWSSLLDMPQFAIEPFYHHLVMNLAAMRFHETVEEGQIEGIEAPDLSDSDGLYNEVAAGSKPPWWPATLDRMSLRITASPDDDAPAQYGPTEYDPNKKDLGKGGFINVLKNMCEAIGKPFQGTVEIRVTRKKDGKWLHGWRGEVTVGQPRHKRGGGFEEGEVDEFTARNDRHAAKTQDAMLNMFSQSAQVISASAAAINAMRGANAPPPWMQQQGEGSPFWQELLMGAGQILLTTFGGGNTAQTAGQVAGQMFQHPMPRGMMGGGGMAPGMPGPYGQPAMIPQQDLGYDAYQAESGEYDGMEPQPEDVLDDGFQEQAYSGSEAWEGDNEEEVAEEEDSYEMPQERDFRPSRGNVDPLEGKSTGEVMTILENWIDHHPNRGEIRTAAMRLARKVM